MMDYQLTVPAIVRRCEAMSGAREVVSRLPDRSIHRTTYAAVIERSRRLAGALAALGIGDGDRVGTLCWNHHAHLEAYLAVPSLGAVVHTLNPRLSADDLAFIASDAGDRALIVDAPLLPVLASFRARTAIEHVIVVGEADELPHDALPYEELLAGGEPRDPVEPHEGQAAAMCYTSGTTGRPKGVLYSHRSTALHSLLSLAADGLAIAEPDVVMPVVPMFHVNAWGLPFTSVLAGAKLVLPGPHLDPESLLELIQGERVTLTAGVPTVWLPLLDALDREPGRWDVSCLRALVIGGSAAPPALIQAFDERHGVPVLHAWGMTEMSPIGTIARVPAGLADAAPGEQLAARASQGRSLPFVEVRARGDRGFAPRDGTTMGELEVRGPTVARSYYGGAGAEQFTEDGWFRTGDVVTVDRFGQIQIQDRAKDLVKSGGEWISSVDLENALMGHVAVAEAAVIAIPDERWQERPLAVVVLRDGATATADELREHLGRTYPKWWLPDRVEFVDAIPRTATGKFLKTALRERYAGP
ncbi:MAG: long-chain fatty acid--CoA ligase [Thermoleophilia bacterium]